MKKNYYLLSILILAILGLSKLNDLESANNISISNTEKLAVTCKIWGFLKYYHPKVADGDYDWDQQLFKVLPKVIHAKTKADLSNIFIDWIDSLGEIVRYRDYNNSEIDKRFNKNFDLSWIDDNQLFTKELSGILKKIEVNRHIGTKYYVSQSRRIGNISVTNEKSYRDFDWKDENLRLLALFRYWNIIEYFFPYKYQTETNWDEVLYQMIPKFLSPKNETEFHLAMLELIVKIDDSHGYFSTPKTLIFLGNKYLPAKISIVENKAIISSFFDDSLALLDDLRIGDIITKIDGKDVIQLSKERIKYTRGSNISRKQYNFNYTVFCGRKDSVKIEYIRLGKLNTKYIKRYRYKELKQKDKEKYKILANKIGYINMGAIEKEDVEMVMDSLIGTNALIIDIRNYPKGTLYSIAGYISSRENSFYKVINPDLNYPGKFIWRDGHRYGYDGELKYQGEVILLVNEETQSHAEFTAMCLQTGDNVITIGSQTSGADGNLSRFEMVGGYKTAISGIGIFYPDERETQRIGVKIDIEIKPTIKGITEGKDEVLEKAIEIASKQ